MVSTSCHLCGHGESYHNVFGICNISDCGPCYRNMVCTRCKHIMFDHSVSDVRVMCTDKSCKLLVCFDKKHPEKPLYTIMNHMGKRVFDSDPSNAATTNTQPTYEEMLAPHPLAVVPRPSTTTTPIVHAALPAHYAPVEDDDPVISPGLWKRYQPGREWDTSLGGYIAVDLNEKYANGSFKRSGPGRVWEPRVHGYVEQVPPGPPERGYVDFA